MCSRRHLAPVTFRTKAATRSVAVLLVCAKAVTVHAVQQTDSPQKLSSSSCEVRQGVRRAGRVDLSVCCISVRVSSAIDSQGRAMECRSEMPLPGGLKYLMKLTWFLLNHCQLWNMRSIAYTTNNIYFKYPLHGLLVLTMLTTACWGLQICFPYFHALY